MVTLAAHIAIFPTMFNVITLCFSCRLSSRSPAYPGETSCSEAREITGMIGAVHYIDRIGDRGESLQRILARRYD